MGQEKESPQDRPSSRESIKVNRRLFIGLAAAIVVAGSTWFVSHGNTSLFVTKGDHVSDSERQARQNAFAALKVFPLSPVRQEEMDAALKSMDLPESQRDALAARMTPAKDEVAPDNPGGANQAAQPKDHPSHVSRPHPQAAARPQEKPVRLAWLTLWDSDVEDGDVVRIDSEGYSRVVVLTKAPVTFAVPVPSGGTINVTGIRDGDGGGITAGIASGPTKLVLPVMSVGQVLGLKVMGD